MRWRLEVSQPKTQAAAAAFSKNPEIRFEYTVISNIYEAGLLPAEAASVIVGKCEQILSYNAAGNRLEAISAPSARHPFHFRSLVDDFK